MYKGKQSAGVALRSGHVETLTLHVVPTHKPLALLPASDRSHKKVWHDFIDVKGPYTHGYHIAKQYNLSPRVLDEWKEQHPE